MVRDADHGSRVLSIIFVQDWQHPSCPCCSRAGATDLAASWAGLIDDEERQVTDIISLRDFPAQARGLAAGILVDLGRLLFPRRLGPAAIAWQYFGLTGTTSIHGLQG